MLDALINTHFESHASCVDPFSFCVSACGQLQTCSSESSLWAMRCPASSLCMYSIHLGEGCFFHPRTYSHLWPSSSFLQWQLEQQLDWVCDHARSLQPHSNPLKWLLLGTSLMVLHLQKLKSFSSLNNIKLSSLVWLDQRYKRKGIGNDRPRPM